MSATDSPGQPVSDDEIVRRLARQLVPLDPGERARLRRMDPQAPSPAALALAIRLLIEAGADDRDLRPPRVHRWALLLQALALLIGTSGQASPHRGGPDAGFGARLRAVLTHDGARDAKESDLRLLTLLEARGAAFDTLLIRMIRRLAAADVKTIDAVGLWRLIADPDSERAERERLRIARDFYRAQPAAAPSAA